MTSVLGHLTDAAFPAEYKNWNSRPPESLFDARVLVSIATDKKAIAANIKKQARYASHLFIWTDCDREGEHIGSEVRTVALEGNARIGVKRARFSNTERAYV